MHSLNFQIRMRFYFKLQSNMLLSSQLVSLLEECGRT